MKRNIIVASLIINLAFILFFAGKRIYYSNGKVPKPVPYWMDTASTAYKYQIGRQEIYDHLTIDSGDVVLVGNSITDFFPSEMLGNIKNRGISGNTSYQIMNRLAPILERKPRIVFIEAGVNDIVHGISTDSIMTNMSTMMGISKLYKTKVYIESVLPVSGDYASFSDSAAVLNEKLKALCGASYINLHEISTYDGVHPNYEEYGVMIRRIRDIIKR